MAYDDVLSNEIFNEIKTAAIEIWKTYDNTYGYVDEKLEMINRITNFEDNWGTMVGMFDNTNQIKLLAKLSLEAQNKVMRWL